MNGFPGTDQAGNSQTVASNQRSAVRGMLCRVGDRPNISSACSAEVERSGWNSRCKGVAWRALPSPASSCGRRASCWKASGLAPLLRPNSAAAAAAAAMAPAEAPPSERRRNRRASTSTASG